MLGMFRRRYDLPLDSDGATRLVPWIIALMSYLAALTLLAAALTGSLAWRWTEGVSGAVTVILAPAGDGAPADDGQRIARARDALASVPGVTGVEVLDAAQVARRLQPWLGAGASAEDLPLPRLLAVRVSAERRPDIDAMRRRLDQAAPGAVVDDHGIWRAEIARLAWRMMSFAGLAVVLIALASAAVVVFAVRAGLAIHRETIEVLHLIGAHDGYIARQFQSYATKLAFQGGLIALVVLGLSEAFLVQAILGLDPTLLPRLDLAPWQWVALGAAPAVLVFLGMLALANATAQHTVRRAIARLV
jgi:cell division transport system permease protein